MRGNENENGTVKRGGIAKGWCTESSVKDKKRAAERAEWTTKKQGRL